MGRTLLTASQWEATCWTDRLTWPPEPQVTLSMHSIILLMFKGAVCKVLKGSQKVTCSNYTLSKIPLQIFSGTDLAAFLISGLCLYFFQPRN